LITTLQEHLIISALNGYFNVIIDNLNVRERDIKGFLKILPENVNVIYWAFETPLEVCIKRNSLRDKPVGVEVIEEKYFYYLNLKRTFLSKQNTNNVKWIV